MLIHSEASPQQFATVEHLTQKEKLPFDEKMRKGNVIMNTSFAHWGFKINLLIMPFTYRQFRRFSYAVSLKLTEKGNINEIILFLLCKKVKCLIWCNEYHYILKSNRYDPERI
jgi:hypothetical protein